MARKKKPDSAYWIHHQGYSRVGFAAAVVREGADWVVLSQTGKKEDGIWLEKKWLELYANPHTLASFIASESASCRWRAAAVPISLAHRKKIWAVKQTTVRTPTGMDEIQRHHAEQEAIGFCIHKNMKVSSKQTAFEGFVNA